MAKGVTLIPKRKYDWVPGTDAFIQHIDQFVGIPDTIREINANDALPVLTLDQDGSGYNLLNEATTPEIRWAAMAQTDPAGRFGARVSGSEFTLVQFLTSGFASSQDFLKASGGSKFVRLQNPVDDGRTHIYGDTTSRTAITLHGEDYSSEAGYIKFFTPNAAKDAAIQRLKIEGAVGRGMITIDGYLTITESAYPHLYMVESALDDPAGRYRFKCDADVFTLERAATSNWGSVTTYLSLDGANGILGLRNAHVTSEIAQAFKAEYNITTDDLATYVHGVKVELTRAADIQPSNGCWFGGQFVLNAGSSGYTALDKPAYVMQAIFKGSDTSPNGTDIHVGRFETQSAGKVSDIVHILANTGTTITGSLEYIATHVAPSVAMVNLNAQSSVTVPTGIKIMSGSGSSYNYGLDLASATVNTADIRFHHGHTITDSASYLALNTVLAMGTNSIIGLPAPTGSGHATRKSYVDAGLALMLQLAGGTMSGAINFPSQNMTNVNIDSGTIDGFTWASIAKGDILYANATPVTTRLAIGTDNYLLSVSTDVPAWLSPANVLADISPLTTRGDIMFRNATVSTSLAKGTAGYPLLMGADDPQWGGAQVWNGAVNAGSQAVTNIDINSGTLAGVTIDGDLTWSSAQTGVTLTSPAINGTISTSGLTLPAFTSGNITMTGAATVDGVDVSAHDANTTTAHGAVSAATASKHVVRDAAARAKFAQSAAAGDAIVADANNRAPDSTLLEGDSKATVQDHTPKAHSIASHNDTTGTGAELEELTDGSETTLHSHAAAGAATMEFWVPVMEQGSTGSGGSTGDYARETLEAGNSRVYFSFKCPHDFTTLTHCKVVFIPVVTGTIDWTVTTDFAADGEAYQTHSDTDTQDGLVTTDLVMQELDVSAALTNLAADDYIGLKFTLNVLTTTTDLHVLGLVFKYA